MKSKVRFIYRGYGVLQLTALAFFIFLVTACEEDELSLDQLSESPGYFIEAYLQPDDIYKLSATRIQPISQEYILDYSIEFQVYIDTLRLFQSLYQDREEQFIYNYGHWDRFRPNNYDDVNLLIVSPTGDSITANTKVPPAISILDIERQGQQFKIKYNASEQACFNYFVIITKQYTTNSENVDRNSFFVNQSDSPEQILTSVIDITSSELDSIGVQIMRCTKENFDYQVSLWSAINANTDNITFPTPLIGNIHGGIGIFTVYTSDETSVIFYPDSKMNEFRLSKCKLFK